MALPISRVSISAMIDTEYDIKVEKSLYPNVNLSAEISYVRTHKQTVVNRKDMGDEIGDLKKDYPDLYIEIIAKVEKFQKELIARAL